MRKRKEKSDTPVLDLTLTIAKVGSLPLRCWNTTLNITFCPYHCTKCIYYKTIRSTWRPVPKELTSDIAWSIDRWTSGSVFSRRGWYHCRLPSPPRDQPVGGALRLPGAAFYMVEDVVFIHNTEQVLYVHDENFFVTGEYRRFPSREIIKRS